VTVSVSPSVAQTAAKVTLGVDGYCGQLLIELRRLVTEIVVLLDQAGRLRSAGRLGMNKARP
jgi:hypothetical protein